MKHIIFCKWIALPFIVCLLSSTGICSLPAQESWARVTENKKAVFVIIRNADAEYQMTIQDGSSSGVMSTWNLSGLYPIDNCNDPIWTFAKPEWFPNTTLISHDGKYLVVPGGWLQQYTYDMNGIIHVFKEGHHTFTLNITDVMSFEFMKYCLAGEYSRCDSWEFDSKHLLLRFHTGLHEEFVIDITNGQVIYHNDPVAKIAMAILGILLICIFAVLSFWIRGRVKRRTTEKR